MAEPKLNPRMAKPRRLGLGYERVGFLGIVARFRPHGVITPGKTLVFGAHWGTDAIRLRQLAPSGVTLRDGQT